MKSKIEKTIEIIGYLLLIVGVLFTFKACKSCNHKDESLNLVVCGSYATPGMFCHDLKGSTFSIDVLETDTQGRVLFRYKTYNDITGANGLAHVICQKSDSRYVYFYEDIGCYSTNSELGFEEWKEQNDWNKSLDIEKMSKRSNKISLDLCIIVNKKLSWNNVTEFFARELKTFDLEKVVFCDTDEMGKFLYWIKRSSNDETAYWGIIDSNYKVSLMEISDDSVDLELLHEFKTKNGWNY